MGYSCKLQDTKEEREDEKNREACANENRPLRE